MARFAYSVRLPTPAAGANIIDIATAATDPIFLLEMGFTNNAATAALIGIERTSAVGTRTTPTATTAASNAINAPAITGAPTATFATAWSVAATLAPLEMYRVNLNAAIGAGAILTWAPDEFCIPISASIMLVNRGAATLPAIDFWVKWVE